MASEVPHAQAAEAIEAAETTKDEELELVEFDALSTSSTSITSSIYRHSYENGRRYHCYRHGKYPIPNDDIEQNREHMKHAMVLELTGGKLYNAPIGDSPQKIIDIGTGTGIWALEMGDRFPGAEVIGVDLSPIQPAWVPPNVKFVVDDVEDEWLSGSDFDLVFMRNLALIVHDLPKLLARVYENLKPGAWIETGDFNANIQCDDGTLEDDFGLLRFWDLMEQAMAKLKIDIRVAPRVGQMMEAAGFVNVSSRIYKVPVGPWAKDQTLKLVGLYMRQVTHDFVGAATKPLLALGMDAAEIGAFLAMVQRALRDDSVHSYGRYFVWTGQKPANGT